MASVQKRKQLVNQLRKAHFPFGFQQHKQQSQYTAKYPGYNEIGYHQATGNKKNNFSIGNENEIDIGAYKSQFKDKFPQYSIKGRQQSIGAKNVEVNNIVFGYGQDNGYKTNYKDDFEKKAATQTTNNRVKPVDLKKNNIQFGDTLSDFTTTYNKVFDQRNINNNPNPSRTDFNDSRKSNLMLGNDKVMFQTQNGITYKNSFVPVGKHVHKQSNVSNIKLGDMMGCGDYRSECKERFTINGKPQREVVGVETVRDFRNAHFNLGFPQQKPIYESQAKNQFNQKPLQVVHIDGRKPSNINLNIDGNNYFQTNYGREFADRGVQPLPQASRNARKDNVLIGTDVDSHQRYISQAKSNFSGSKTIPPVKPIITSGTFKLGEQKTDFRTHNQLTYDDKFSRNQNIRLTKDDINRMKTINIVTGFEGNSYNLHSTQYGKQQGERGQLPKETLSKMKNTNIVLQTIPMGSGAETSYKVSYPFKINHDY